MKRNIDRFRRQRYDVLVIGGGVYGAIVAWDAALRGLSVGLIEKDDFGGGTSANSLRTVHGGLRYLQHGDIKRMRESIGERRTLMRIAPHLVHPLPVLMPTYRTPVARGKAAMSVALKVNDWIGWDRNQLSDSEKFLPDGRILTANETLSLAPGIRTAGLTGGALWFDAQMFNSERLTLSFVLSAARAGADVANYFKADELLQASGRVYGVRGTDRLTGDRQKIEAKLVINAAGPWVDAVLGRAPSETVPLTKAFNLVLRRPLSSSYALGVSAPGKPVYFIAPWRGLTLAGTRHLPHRGDADDRNASEKEIQDFITEINLAFPGARLKRADVLYPLSGLLPGTVSDNDVELWQQYKIIDHEAREDLKGLISVVGVKYTTARDVAERTVDMAISKLGADPVPCRTQTMTVVGGHFTRFAEFLSDQIRRYERLLDTPVIRHLVYSYGSEFERVLEESDRVGFAHQCLSRPSLVIKAEVLNAVRNEMAQTLSDVVFRRTDLAREGDPGVAALESCAMMMAEIHEWNDDRTRSELEKTRQELASREPAMHEAENTFEPVAGR